MSAKIVLARGSKTNKTGGLTYGELFWESTKSGEMGTLYIGKPDGASAADMAIGGARAMQSLFYRGTLAGGTAFPLDAKTGDFWVMTADGTSALIDYKTNDWLVATSSSTFTRVNNSGGVASQISYNHTGTSLAANNVQDAITDLAKLKMQYAGQVNLANEAATIAAPIIGGLYLITQDGVTIAGMTPGATAIKGDWAFYDGATWTHIPAGYTEADSTAFNNVGVTLGDGTTAVTTTNVQTALVDLYEHKADLVAGKVPVSQLPASVVGGLQYQGTWDISGTTPVLPADTDVGHYYVIIGADSTPITVGGLKLTTGDWIVRDTAAWESVQGGGAVDAITVGTSHLQGDVEFAGSDKISVTPSGNIITVAGQSLVDYDTTIPTAALGNVPRLVATTGKIGAGSINDTGSIVDVAANFTVGSAQAIGTGTPKTAKFYGDITLGATGESASKATHGLIFQDKTSGTVTVKPADAIGGAFDVVLPSASGTLIVKNSTTTANFLTKSTANGVIADAGISDDGSNVTFHESVIVGATGAGNNLNVTVFGAVKVGDVNSTYTASIVAPGLTSGITLTLPNVSGVLATTDDITSATEGAIDGTANTLAMFDSTGHAVVDSVISEAAGAGHKVTVAAALDVTGLVTIGDVGTGNSELDIYGPTKFFNLAGDKSVTFSRPTGIAYSQSSQTDPTTGSGGGAITTIQYMPDQDGQLLNNNSTVDGGVW